MCYTMKLHHLLGDCIEVGVDEVGRGSLAGPVAAAAVIWPTDSELDYSRIKDSKAMTAKERHEVEKYIKENAIEWSVKFIDNGIIDRKNILEATFDAMHDALDSLTTPVDIVLVDGDKFRPWKDVPYKCIVKGDATYVSIAAASILAKEARDEYMKKMAEVYPGYGWETNVGYGTRKHEGAIIEKGLTPLHRRSFCRNFIG